MHLVGVDTTRRETVGQARSCVSMSNAISWSIEYQRSSPSCRSPESTSRRSTSFSCGRMLARLRVRYAWGDVYQSQLLHVGHEGREIAEITAVNGPLASAPESESTRRNLLNIVFARAPVVGLRRGRLLVAQQPSVAVRGMDDIHVAPDERPRRWSEGRLREGAPFVRVRVAVFVFFAGACADCNHREREGQQGRELHFGRQSLQCGRTDGESGSDDARAGCSPHLGYLYLPLRAPVITDRQTVFDSVNVDE